ncbi:MAG: hypothetical protein PHZ00_03900 [Candidatus Peribacteraceae bacterium]|nr:hypothetical protein [Candidatus Peribacteraceae bacterium]
MLHYFVLIGAAVDLLGASFYIRGTLQAKTKPNRVSWLIWSLGSMIASAAALAQGVTWAVIPVFVSGAIPLMIFAASFVNPKSYWKLGIWDYACGAISALALILWVLTKNPNAAIIFAIVGDVFAWIPTFAKSWKQPETESASQHFSGLFNSFTTFAAVRFWSLSEIAFPIWLIVGNATLLLAIYRVKLTGRNSRIP